MQPFRPERLHPVGEFPARLYGRPPELGSGFADEAVATLKQRELRATDPQLAAALGAGWYLAACVHAPARITPRPRPRSRWAAPPSNPDRRPCSAATRSRRRRRSSRSRSNAPGSRRPRSRLVPENAPQADNDMLGALSAADFRLGKAHGVGGRCWSRPAALRPADAQGAPHEHHRRAAGRGSRSRHGAAAARGQSVRDSIRSGKNPSIPGVASRRSHPRRGSRWSVRASCGERCWPARRPAATCSRSTTTSMPPNGSPSGCAGSSPGSW